MAENATKNPALERSVLILDWLAQSNTAQNNSLANIARDLDLPKSSVHSLLASLVTLELAERYADGHFKLGPKALRWAAAYGTQNDLASSFQTLAENNTALREETIMLAVLRGTEVLYLAYRPGQRALGVNFRVGGSLPAHCTSSGKAILATWAEADVKDLLGTGPFKKLTDKTLISPRALITSLRSTRDQGYALDDEETAIGMHCFGAPVFEANQNRAHAAVAVSLIKASTNAAKKKQTVQAITTFAHELSRKLGGAK